jgi:hypothetical protein
MKKLFFLPGLIGAGLLFVSCGADINKAANEMRPAVQGMSALIEKASLQIISVQSADEAAAIIKETAGKMKQIILEMKAIEKKFNLTPDESKKLVKTLKTEYNTVGTVLVSLNSNINTVLEKYKDNPKEVEKLMDALLSLREIGSM